MALWPLATAFAAPIAGRLAARSPAGALGGIGLAAFAAGLLLLALLPAHPGNADIAWRMAVCGLGFGLFRPPTTAPSRTPPPPTPAAAPAACPAPPRSLGQPGAPPLRPLMFNRFAAPAPPPP